MLIIKTMNGGEIRIPLDDIERVHTWLIGKVDK